MLLDLMMPVMDGEETLDEIRKLRPDVPVIGSSGYSEFTAKERFRGKGLAAFLQKPYKAQVLAILVSVFVVACAASLHSCATVLTSPNPRRPHPSPPT